MRAAARCALVVRAALLTSGALIPAAGNAAQPQHTVTIDGVQYSPPELTVRRGERIVWVNKDPFPHTVTAAAGQFDSGSIAAGASWTFRAAKRGEYAYGCRFHPTMKGTIHVQ
ncbi:MAG TPA: cupredoxin family copper-binding protein [Steroidobacteraceae bacterium]|nr:cupredoxin family copper-binding protein [Steroidobacteraceae bacterium]